MMLKPRGHSLQLVDVDWKLVATGASSYLKQGSRSFVQLRLTLKDAGGSGELVTEVMEVGIEQFYSLLKSVELVNAAVNA